jgi:hypothetical protein
MVQNRIGRLPILLDAIAGIVPAHADGASDLVLRNVNSGAFEVYC